MSLVPIPLVVSQRISELATRRAREGLSRRNWSEAARASLQPAPAVGQVGIKTSLRYLMYQNRGIKPFLMTSLEGKTVPIKGKLFRVKGVGLPGWGYQDRKYNPIKGSIWREQRWRHPGIRPERFLENAISQAILESKAGLQEEVMRALRGEQER
ncbi:hypothetical protein KHQ84_gp040 [Rhodococcus phage Finch]|uniref:Uncharacterized protein n=1 Tax=Rhodococcus phage Finch TaxID=2094144 RepID=A0A2P1JXD5_9CAUD|nr:hypothetical protein KHQ84_gp040 [Rhodococcus phage Finch]AVO24980.1 hypothetical protein SEA_FINCH_40 [Rhodococcus phage Finch]